MSRLPFEGEFRMSKADCERFDSSQTEPPSSEFAGAAVARNLNNNHKADLNAISRTLQELIAQSEALKVTTDQKLQQLQNVPGLHSTSEITSMLKPDLDAAWEQLCLAWYELKLETERGANFKH
jgi:hypothetical protein